MYQENVKFQNPRRAKAPLPRPFDAHAIRTVNWAKTGSWQLSSLRAALEQDVFVEFARLHALFRSFSFPVILSRLHSFRRGLRKLVFRNLSAGFGEIYRIANKNAQIAQLRRYVPELKNEDAIKYVRIPGLFSFVNDQGFFFRSQTEFCLSDQKKSIRSWRSKI